MEESPIDRTRIPSARVPRPGSVSPNTGSAQEPGMQRTHPQAGLTLAKIASALLIPTLDFGGENTNALNMVALSGTVSELLSNLIDEDVDHAAPRHFRRRCGKV